MTNEIEFFDGVIGGSALPVEQTRKDIATFQGIKPLNALDRKMARLLTLHPELQVKFRNNTWVNLNDETKKALVEDMQEILGIEPLRK